MKLGILMASMLFSGVCWAESNDIERLNRVVEEQTMEIEQLKAQIARIERVLAINATPQPAAVPATLVSYVPQTPAQAVAPAAAPTAANAAGFRFSGDFRFRLDAAIR